MEVHVLGGSGFVGSHLCNELADRGHDPVAVSRNPDDSAVVLDGDVERREGDVTDPDSLDLAGADAVVQLVALSPLFKPRGTTHVDVHLAGTEHAVAAAEDADVDHFLQMSALGADPDGTTAYIRAKGDAEAVVESSDLDWTIFRPSVIFGEGGEFERFTKLLTTPYLTGLPGGGRNRFQPIHVGDLVGMLADALEAGADGDDEDDDAAADLDPVGATYEIGGPEVLSLADMTRLVYRSEGKSVRILPIPMPLARLGLTLADPLPFVPLGLDQYRSLKIDNVVESGNDVAAFGVEESELETYRGFLGIA